MNISLISTKKCSEKNSVRDLYKDRKGLRPFLRRLCPQRIVMAFVMGKLELFGHPQTMHNWIPLTQRFPEKKHQILAKHYCQHIHFTYYYNK